MPSSKNRPLLNRLVTIPVALIVLAAFAVCSAALVENLRFIKSTNQMLWIVSAVRSVATQQKGFAQNNGEDIWADLVGAGQLSSSVSHLNPWEGELRAVTLGNSTMRIENDVPPHDCRRLALYFIGRQPVDLGLLAVEAQSAEDTKWTPLYPLPTIGNSRTAADIACGNGSVGRLALIFKVR